ncbi:IS1595 family transposase [Rhodovibrio sodomensis]|uniref:IS1595 family transposase n=1 Tax=Rhodovibrio sodomensis TaxID=1088 RepID=A0ABS1DE16_9PROT|nr:IS1595 family transposase [Rhodovibrio sodomensis]MBK1668167.1 IS1595 family transposase [Rhodovibrio sodomensis]
MCADLTALKKRVRTAADAMVAFSDEVECRRILEAMVWPQGRFCPFCGSLNSAPIAGRDLGKKARPGLYQCAERECRGQFTVTTHTPLHSTKLKLSIWLQAIWLSLQTDKGMSSPRLAELVGVTQTTAWRMGHVIRLLMAPGDELLDGRVEADEVMVGGKPRRDPSDPDARRNKQGHTTKRPVLVAVQRPEALAIGGPPGRAVARPLTGLSAAALHPVISTVVAATAALMTDQHGAFAVVGRDYADHQSVNHGQLEYVRGDIHVNSAEGFNDRVRRTVAGVFHHISQKHAERYLDEVAFRWNQRICIGTAIRTSRKGTPKVRAQYDRLLPVTQMRALFAHAFGRQMRRTPEGSLVIV